MANIHQMYGEECELHRHTEEARAYLLDVLVDLKNGKTRLAQLEFPIAGGIRIIPLSELPPVADDEAKPDPAKGMTLYRDTKVEPPEPEPEAE